MKYLKATLLGSGALASLLLSSVLTSCQDEDFGYTSEEISAAAYKRNFEAMYGEIAPNQTWDFSAYALHQQGLVGGPGLDATSATRGASAQNTLNLIGEKKSNYHLDPLKSTAGTKDVYVSSDYETGIADWLNANLTERSDHKNLGKPFQLINDSEQGFLIVPVYLGQSGMVWDLHLVDGSGDYMIWSKSEGVSYREDYTLWEEFHYNNANGSKDDLSLADAFAKLAQNDVNVLSTVKLKLELPDVTDANGNQLDNSVKVALALEVDGVNRWIQDFTDKQYTHNYGSKTTYEIDVTSLYQKSIATSDNDKKVKVYNKGWVDAIVQPNLSNLVLVIQDKNNTSLNTYNANHLRIHTQYGYIAPESNRTKLHNYSNWNGTTEQYEAGKSTSYFTGHTINKHHVESPTLWIDHNKIGPDFYFYLDVVYSDANNADYAQEGAKQSSKRDMMRAITSVSGAVNQSNLNKFADDCNFDRKGQNCSYMFIGCEDANGKKGDWDYNDVVLLVVGLPKIPTVAEDIIEKRYMIEDLGSTFDFDFNDIVVDVKQAKINNVTKQTATITHLCGTIPYQLFIGDTPFTPVMEGQNGEDHLGVNPKGDAFTFNITGWDPNSNNISVLVWPDRTYESFKNVDDKDYTQVIEKPADGNFSHDSDLTPHYNVDTKGARQINFPKNGEQPYIIAFDPEVTWREEHQSVPRSWFKTESIINDYNNNTIDGGTVVNGSVDTELQHLQNNGYMLLSSNYITEGGTTGNNNTNATPTTIDITQFLIDKVYTNGNIEIAMVLPGDAPDFAETYGIITAKQGVSISDDRFEFKNFETENNAKVKTFTMKTGELLSLAKYKSSELKLQVDYSTFGFTAPQNTDDANAYTRVLLKFNKSTSNINTSEFGTKYNYQSSNVTKNNNNTHVNLKPFFNSYNGSDDILVTIVNPTGTNINGRICTAGSNQSDMLEASAGSTGQLNITDAGFKAAVNDNNKQLYFEVYGGRDMFDPDLIIPAQIYIKTQPSADPTTFGIKFIYNESQDKVTSNVGDRYDVVDLTRALTNYAGGKIEVRVVNKANSYIGAQIKLRNNDYTSAYVESDWMSISSNSTGLFELTDEQYTNKLHNSDGKLVMFINEDSYEAFQQSEVYIKFNQEISTSFTGKEKPSSIWINGAASTNYGTYNGNNWLEVVVQENAANDWDTQLGITLGNISKGAKVSFSYNTWKSGNDPAPAHDAYQQATVKAILQDTQNGYTTIEGSNKQFTFGTTTKVEIDTQNCTIPEGNKTNFVLQLSCQDSNNNNARTQFTYTIDDIDLKITYFE